jgi:stress response protein SCP2
MMTALRSLSRGERVAIDQLTPGDRIFVGLDARSPGMTFEACCIGVDERGKLTDERFFVFGNQRQAPGGAIELLGAGGEDLQRYALDLSQIPRWVDRLLFTLHIEGRGKMEYVEQGHIRLWDDGWEVARFSFDGTLFMHEKSLIVGEIYRKDGWRFCAQAQGFNSGIGALLAHVGRSQVPLAAR